MDRTNALPIAVIVLAVGVWYHTSIHSPLAAEEARSAGLRPVE